MMLTAPAETRIPLALACMLLAAVGMRAVLLVRNSLEMLPPGAMWFCLLNGWIGQKTALFSFARGGFPFSSPPGPVVRQETRVAIIAVS